MQSAENGSWRRSSGRSSACRALRMGGDGSTGATAPMNETKDLNTTVDEPGTARPDPDAAAAASLAVDTGLPTPTRAGLPRTIGRYRVIRLLGQGGFGTVYLARDDDLDRPVAIKVPNPERVAVTKDAEQYLAE